MDSPLELPAPLASALVCENCKAENPVEKKFCSKCSYPIGGTAEEQQSFRLLVSSRKRLLSDAQDKMKSAKTTIYILAAVFFGVGLFVGLYNEDVPTAVAYLVMSVLYLIFAAWATNNPFGAILTAFLVYVTMHVANAFVDPATLFHGLIIKIVIIIAFVKGIRSARDAQEYLAELKKFNAAPVGNE